MLIPKSKKIAVVGGWFGERFADNSKYFYLYVNDNLNNLGLEKIVWVTRSKEIKNELTKKGHRVYYVWSIPSIWYHLRGKYHFIDQSPIDINAFFSVRSKRINLWHGFPLKKIGAYTGLKHTGQKTKFKKWINKFTTRGCWSDCYVLATSEFSAAILKKAFGVNTEKIIISSYPRSYEPIFKNPIKYISYNERKNFDEIRQYVIEGYKIIGYFPTFRDKKETLIFGTENIEEINQFLDYCENTKIKIVGKFHFAEKNDKFGAVESHEAFINLPSKADIYTFLSQINVLITDYSSIYFDFLLWNRPIIFFPYDLDYYRYEDRGLIFDYEEFTPGSKVHNIEELKSLLSKDLNVYTQRYKREYADKASKLRAKIFGDYKIMGIRHLLNQIDNKSFEEANN